MDWRSNFMACSRLDTYLQYLTGDLYPQLGETEPPPFTDEDLIRKLLKLEPATEKMEAGTAFHKLIEDSGYGELPEHSIVDDWRIEIACDGILEYPPSREVFITKSYNGIPLVARVDGMNSHTIYDLKTTSKYNIEKYMQSMQWKAYLWLSGYNRFQYDVFLVNVKLDTELDAFTAMGDTHITESPIGGGEILVKEHHKFILYRYPGMDYEVINCMIGFWNLLDYLKPQIFDMAKMYDIDLTKRIPSKVKPPKPIIHVPKSNDADIEDLFDRTAYIQIHNLTKDYAND